jgi:hypothetical protein
LLTPELVTGLKQGVLVAVAVLALVLAPRPRAPAEIAAAGYAEPVLRAPRLADFTDKAASAEARLIANWVANSRDNQGLPFVIIDKKEATVFVFDADARIIGSTPVLLGAALGDDSVAGIGERPIADIKPEERTTPAGRFLAEPGRNTAGEDVVWVDYEAAVSMHRVRVVDPEQRRLERMATATPDDNRISYGCINVPVRFFEDVLQPVFDGRRSPVYVLPEIRTVQQVFPAAFDPLLAYQQPAPVDLALARPL